MYLNSEMKCSSVFSFHFDQNIMLTFMTHDKEVKKVWAHAFELIEPSSSTFWNGWTETKAIFI